MRYISKEHLAVGLATSKDQNRYTLNGVLLEETEKGLRAVSTNGRILAMVESETAFTEGDFPVIEALKNAPNTEKSANIPLSALKQASKGIVRKKSLPILQEIAVKFGKELSTLVSTDLESQTIVPTRNIEGQFPSYQQVIPKDEVTQFKIAFNPRLLEIALKIASDVMDSESVVLHFTNKDNPLKIVGKKQGYTVTIVVMPSIL